jgi:hypothetical protein
MNQTVKFVYLRETPFTEPEKRVIKRWLSTSDSMPRRHEQNIKRRMNWALTIFLTLAAAYFAIRIGIAFLPGGAVDRVIHNTDQVIQDGGQ